MSLGQIEKNWCRIQGVVLKAYEFREYEWKAKLQFQDSYACNMNPESFRTLLRQSKIFSAHKVYIYFTSPHYFTTVK